MFEYHNLDLDVADLDVALNKTGLGSPVVEDGCCYTVIQKAIAESGVVEG
jgi:hypothetical protein